MLWMHAGRKRANARHDSRTTRWEMPKHTLDAGGTIASIRLHIGQLDCVRRHGMSYYE